MKWFVTALMLTPTIGFCLLWFFAERRRNEERYWFEKHRAETQRRIDESERRWG